MTRVVAVLQARASSSRLPGKVLLPLAGAPMIARQIERIQRARGIDRLVLATSDRMEDDSVAAVADATGIDCHRGSLDNVLDRFHAAAALHHPEWVVRLTGDCPLADWDVIDRCVRFAIEGDFDYASNTLVPTWPDGLDVEVCKFTALGAAWREARTAVEIEHVMPFITGRPERFRLGSLENDVDLSAMRWTVDEQRDYLLIRLIYDTLYPRNQSFSTEDILDFLVARPELVGLNAGIARNEGLLKTAYPN